MTIRTGFDMYLAPPSAPAFTAMAETMRRAVTALRWAGEPFGDWHVGQVCGITLATEPEARFRYLSTPCLDEVGVPPGRYNSLIITPRDGGLAALSDFDPARHLAAINEPGSFSGALTFIAHMRRNTGHTLSDPALSGGHLNSVAMVAEGAVQLAAIDRASFRLAGAANPDAAAAVKVIDETKFYPAPALVADGALPETAVAPLRRALAAFRADPAWEALHAILGWRECRQLDRGSYDVMASVGR